ncbi:MAG: hypothetical protein NT027_00655, partial [Proteobacteria bacterium]|nr:hypothetical protein [Pseudomonadota bacterium]
MQDETILNIDQKDFVVMVFDLAIAALDCDEAKFLISKLSLNSPERQICLQKLLTLTSKYQERESKTESPIAKFVDEIKRDPKALQSLLNKVRSESQDRIFINSVDEFLRKFTDEIKPDKKVYYEVSRILAGSRDLIDLLPNLFQFFFYQSSSKLFLEPISARVWEVWNLVDPKNETEEFWSRVALLQKHLTGHTEVFDNLWIKIEGYRASKDCQTQKTHKWWSIFIESQLEHIQNAQNLPPTKKAFWAASLKLLKLDRPIDENSYFVFKDNLLANCQAMDDYYLNYFWKNKKFGAFTKSIRSPMCPNGFTNENLCRIWTSAIHCNESDLAWRTMSVLVSRVEVEPLLYESWKVSGELRSFYPINSVSRQEVALATSDLDQVNSAIINSLLTLSDKLNRIISDIFCTLRSNRFSKGNNGPIERRILEVI